MTPEQVLAGLQDEVRGLSETVQRLASENETLRSPSTVGAVRTVTMANEVARLNDPTAFNGAEEGRCARQLKRSARRHAEQLLCTCPGPSDAERRAHEIHHMPYRSWCEYCVRGRGKESPHLSRYEQADDGIPVVQMDYAFLHDTGDKEAKVTFLTMVDNSSGQMVATAVQKKRHDKFVERFLLKGLESFGVTGEMVLLTDKETGPIDVAKHVAAERKATTIIRQTPKKSSQSNAYVERAHQSVETMVRTMKEVIEDKSTHQIERDRQHHELDDSTRSILANTFLCWKGRQNTIQETTSQRLHEPTSNIRISCCCQSPRRGNRTQQIPDSFQVFGLEEPQRAMSTLSNSTGCLHSKVRAKNDQEIWNSGLIKSMKGTPWAPRAEDSQAEVRMPEKGHRPMIGWNTNTRMLRDFWNEMGKTAGCVACESPGGKKHNVASLYRQEEWKNRTIPQPEPVTRETDAEMQQDNQAPEPSS